MGDLIDATGFVCVDFNRDNHVVHVRLNYHVYTRKRGYHMEITNTDSLEPSILEKLQESKIKAKILGFILDQAKPTVNPLEASPRLALSEGQKEQNRMKR